MQFANESQIAKKLSHKIETSVFSDARVALLIQNSVTSAPLLNYFNKVKALKWLKMEPCELPDISLRSINESTSRKFKSEYLEQVRKSADLSGNEAGSLQHSPVYLQKLRVEANVAW